MIYEPKRINVRKAGLGLLNQADLGLIPRLCFWCYLPIALKSLSAPTFETIRLYCLREREYTYFWGFYTQ